MSVKNATGSLVVQTLLYVSDLLRTIELASEVAKRHGYAAETNVARRLQESDIVLNSFTELMSRCSQDFLCLKISARNLRGFTAGQFLSS